MESPPPVKTPMEELLTLWTVPMDAYAYELRIALYGPFMELHNIYPLDWTP